MLPPADQANPAGDIHALTCLTTVSDSIHVFTSPTKFLNALWLPYRDSRKEDELVAAIQDAGAVNAVFAHADVRDAFMNDLRRSSSGDGPTALHDYSRCKSEYEPWDGLMQVVIEP